LIEFDWDFQELMKFEQGTPDCTWMAINSEKGAWNSNLGISLLLLEDSNRKLNFNFFQFA
jgi:hypothetical protein